MFVCRTEISSEKGCSESSQRCPASVQLPGSSVVKYIGLPTLMTTMAECFDDNECMQMIQVAKNRPEQIHIIMQ